MGNGGDNLHILFTTYEFVTEKKPCGGCGHYIANIASILAAHGNKVTILVQSDYNRRFLWKEGVEVIVFRYEYIASTGNILYEFMDRYFNIEIAGRINQSLAFKKKIEEINRKEKINIIQYNGDHLEGWHKCKRIPSVVRLSSISTWYKQAYNIHSDMKDLSWINSWESKWFFYPLVKADAVYAPSKCVADFVNSKLEKRVRVIESPGLIQAAVNENSNPDILQNKKYLLFFGRVCVLKGVDTIIRALPQILKEYPELYFVFAGNIERKGVELQIKKAAGEAINRVLILGEIKDSLKMQTLIKYSEACVLPSRADNLPNSCIEAMGLGKVVIGTYGASFEQMIQHKESGILIRTDSANALMKAVRYVMSMPDSEKYEMGERAKARIRHMHPDLIYLQVMKFYQTAIKNGFGGKHKYYKEWVKYFLSVK